jgi:DNA-binding response OmpR family regulator/tetratricopeptide (TPR) repeat protein
MGKQALIVSRSGDYPAMLGRIVGEEWDLCVVPTSQEALTVIAGMGGGGAPDLILLENDLADLDGLSFLRIVQDRLGDVPPTVLCVPRPLDEAGHVRAEKFSLLDILVKPVQPASLERALAPLLWVSSGSLQTMVEFLGTALRQGFSGTYRVQSSSMVLDVELKQGKLLQVSSSLFLERWRVSLGALGIPIPPADPDTVTDLRLIEATLRYTPELLQAKAQALLSLFSAFSPTEALVVRKVGGVESQTDLPVALFGLLASLVNHCTEEHLAPLRSEVLALTPGLARPSQDMPLFPQHGYLLSLCTTTTPIQSVLRTGVMPEAQLLRSVYLLLILGLLRTEPEIPEPFSLAALASKLEEEARRIRVQKEGIRNLDQGLRASGQSPYDILGVPPGAPYPRVVQSFESLRWQLGPLALHPKVLKEMEKEVGWINAKVSEAFLLIQAHWLNDRHQRIEAEVKEVDEKKVHRIGADMTQHQQISQKRLDEAERLYRRAVSMMEEEEDYHQASQYVKLALFYNPLSAPYHFLQGRLLALMKSPRAKHQAEKSFLRAIELDSFTVEYRVALARLYLSLDLFTRCRSQMEKIQALDPKNPELLDLKKAVKEGERN